MINLSIKVKGKVLEKKYANIIIYKEVNKIPTATLTILDGNVAREDFEESSGGQFNPGEEIEVFVDNASLFKGIILKHRVVFEGLSSGELVLECKDTAVALSLVRRSRHPKPNEKEMDFIKKTVLTSKYAGTLDSFKTFREVQQNLMQYDCTDWDFTLSRAELQGMLVSVKDGKVSLKKPKLEKSVRTLTYGENLRSFKGEIDARYQFDSVKSTGWDYKNQEKRIATGKDASLKNTGDLTQQVLSEALGLKAIELQGSSQLEKTELEAWASAQLFKSRMAMIRGTASCEGNDINPLDTVALKGLSKRFNGQVLVTGIQHRIVRGTWVTVLQFGLSPKWFSQSENFHSPPAAGLLPAIQGLQIGKVLEQADQDPDKQDRVKVSLPTVDPKKGIWARQALFSTGAVFRPVKDDEVILGFLNHDPRQPIILGVLNNKNAATAVKSTEDKDNEKTAIYAPHNDGKDIYIQFDKKEHSIEIKNKKRGMLFNEKEEEIQVTNDQTMIHMTKDTIALTADNIVLKGNKTIDLQTKEATLKASGALNLEGQEATLKGNGGGVTLDGQPSTKVNGGTVTVNAKNTLTLEGKKADLTGDQASIKGKATTMVG